MTVLSQDNTQEKILETAKPEETLKENIVPSEQKATEKDPETQEDPNWRAFREARKKDRAEKEAAQRLAAEKEAEAQALRAAMEAAFAKSPPPQAQQQTYYSQGFEQEESEDERIEKKVQAAIAKREAESERLRQEREYKEYPEKLTKNYPDFHHVINQETLDYLDYHYPEVSRPLQRLQDGYDKWEDIYRAVKKFVPSHTTAKKDAAKADVNTMKPRSMSATGMTQTQENMGIKLTEDRKAANWERMRRTMNSVA
jgi:hypothetical protein